MTSMFEGATSFNKYILHWVIKTQDEYLQAVTVNFTNMFKNATAFNSIYNNLPQQTDYTNGETPLITFFGKPTGNTINDNNFKLIVQLWLRDSTLSLFNSSSNKPYFGSISTWNVSSITNMSDTFLNATSFNDNISSWSVSNVTNFTNMFKGATTFDQDISSWTVSKVTDMSNMFNGALKFSQDISNWNTSNVRFIAFMFDGASSFNQDDVDYEFIELYNASNDTLDMSGWKFSSQDGINFTFD